MHRLPRPVWLLGWVSLLTDAASEAIYPLLPYFLTSVLGGTAFALGVVEGVAEGTNSIVRLLSGRLADRRRTRRGLVFAGYALSSVVRPLVGVATSWPQVVGIRFADRVGKGVRSAPRDALLTECADPGDRGRVFGFHRAMDHAGAVVGPLAATAFLWWQPGAYRTLFLLTALPGALAVLLVLRVREPGMGARQSAMQPVPSSAPSWRDVDGPRVAQSTTVDARATHVPRSFYAYLAVLALFTIGNSSDAFLLLRLTEAIGGPEWIPLLWAAHHVVKSSLSTRGGALSDRLGRKPVIAGGWLVYAIVYAGFAVSASAVALILWLLVYGLYFALAEGTEKALVADLAPAGARGTAFGLFHAVTGLGSLGASLLFGMVWTTYGRMAAFSMGAGLALAATGLLWVVVPSRRNARQA